MIVVYGPDDSSWHTETHGQRGANVVSDEGAVIKCHELVRVIFQSSDALASEIKETPRATNLFVISE